MENNIYSFYKLVTAYKVEIPIIQRDYAQGRERNRLVCENFLRVLRENVINDTQINLDFIYGNVEDQKFLPLDGQQRLTTLFLLHWYASLKKEWEEGEEDNRQILKRFSYETRLSSRRFCEALIDCCGAIDPDYDSISGQILDSQWFFISWKYDPTIRAMLRTIDLIDDIFGEVDGLWEALVRRKNVIFHLLILENFGLSDDLYIKMNARGRLLTPFENLKAEIQDKSSQQGWEENRSEPGKFSYKIDIAWTRFLWRNFRKKDSVDAAHMNFITTLVMAKLCTSQRRKGSVRIDIIQKLNEDNAVRELIRYIDEETFHYLYDAYERYCGLFEADGLPSLEIDLWRHTPEKNLLNQILVGSNTSYSHKILFFAQTEYLLRNRKIVQERFEEWMRVVRNILSRADITPDGKRNDIVRSPEGFNGAVNLVNQLAEGCDDIYRYLRGRTVHSVFAREQVREETLKADILHGTPERKGLIFRTEDNELLRGRILFALECANYRGSIDEIDFGLLEKVQAVFEKYFNKELAPDSPEFDKFRRAMLTIKWKGNYHYYDYWWSYWNAGDADKRKLFPIFREIEYFIGLADYKPYFRKLVRLLITKDYDEIISEFAKPDSMENWQYRLIKEEALLSNSSSKYIAIPQDRSCCYLLKSKRTSDVEGSRKVV